MITYKGKTERDSTRCKVYWKAVGKLFNVYPDSVLLLSGDGTVEGPDEMAASALKIT